MSSIRILNTVNSSLFLSDGQTDLLVDGLHGSGDLFSPMPGDVRTRLRRGIAPYEQVDALLFTHAHPDHFSLEETEAYLKLRPVRFLVLPPDSGQPPETNRVLSPLLRYTDYLRPAPPPDGEVSFDIGTFHITYLNIPHIPVPCMPALHCPILLENGDLTILIGGDMDYLNEEQLGMLHQKHIDYAFFIPFYLFHRKGHHVIRSLDLRMTFLYHMPYPNSSNLEFLKLVRKDMACYAAELAPIRLLEPGGPEFTLQKP